MAMPGSTGLAIPGITAVPAKPARVAAPMVAEATVAAVEAATEGSGAVGAGRLISLNALL